MPNRKPPPDYEELKRVLHSDLIQRSKPTNPEVKKRFNASPFYKPKFEFKSSVNGAVSFKVSRLARDWPTFQLKSQTEQFVRGFMQFSYLWLQRHGYSPVKIVLCDGYPGEGQINVFDDQRELRQRILSDYLCPTNATKKSMLEWKGILCEESEANARGYTIDYGVKTE